MRRDSEEGGERSERTSVSEAKCERAGIGERVYSRDCIAQLGKEVEWRLERGGGETERGARRVGTCSLQYLYGDRLTLFAQGGVVISEPERGITQLKRRG